MNKITTRTLLASLTMLLSAREISASDLTDISPITDKIIMLRFDDGYFRHYGYGQNPSNGTLAFNSPLDEATASSRRPYRISSPDDPDYQTALPAGKVGRKSKLKDASQSNQYIKEHFIYLQLTSALKPGKTYTVSTGTLARNRNEITFAFDVKRMQSESIHTSQAGYIPDGPKYAYVSQWMGDMGPLDLDGYAGVQFKVIRTSDSTLAYSGALVKRRDLETGSTSDGPDVGEKTYANADVWECDFSALTLPGEYLVVIDRMGCSYPFKIGGDVYREAFYHAARALYHNRTGIELTRPYTEWTRPKTPRDGTVFKYSSSRQMDWSGENGDPAEVRSKIDADFKISTWGWYQDAGDWDGYFSHVHVPLNLLTAYELAPEKFSDGELNIPESGNGVPDIVDEGAWLVNYFNRTKGPTGGVCGARVAPDFDNTVESPERQKPSWEDPRFILVSGEEPNTNFVFAGLACQLAYSYELAGDHSRTQALVDSGVKAYNWAVRNKKAGDNLQNSDLYAAAWLYKQTGDAQYLTFFEDNFLSRSDDSDLYRWALFAYAMTGRPVNAAKKANAVGRIVGWADVESANPSAANSFRVGINPWFPLFLGQATTPMCFISAVAYRLTNKVKYLDAVKNTASYYTGGNPLNLMWMSNFGQRHPNHLFHMDTWLRPDRNPEFFPGIVPYGPMDPKRDWMPPGGWWAASWAAGLAYPAYSAWPGHELFFNNRYCPPTNEFTVHQSFAVAAAVYGLLCDRAPASFIENARPKVAITFPADGSEFKEGGKLDIQVSSSDTDDYVRVTEYFYNHHWIGRSGNNRMTWNNVPPGAFKLIAVAVDNRGRRSVPDTIAIKVTKVTSTSDGTSPSLPGNFRLHQNYPNPFNPDTIIRYDIPEQSEVAIRIINTSGRSIRTLVEGIRAPGGHSVFWDGKDDSGQSLPSGLYFCRMSCGADGRAAQNVRKMALLK